VHRKLFDDESQMALVNRNEIVHAFPAGGSDQPLSLAQNAFAFSARTGVVRTQAESSQGRIDASREDGVAVMDDEQVRVVDALGNPYISANSVLTLSRTVADKPFVTRTLRL
jgi:hypothetical protein